MAFLELDDLWPHLAPASRIGVGQGWVAFDKPSEVAALRRAPAEGGGDVLTRLARARGLAAEAAAGWTLAFDAIGGGRRSEGPHAARASGVVVVAEGLGVAEQLAAMERRGEVRLEYVAAVEDFPSRPGPARAGLVHGLAALGFEVELLRAQGRRGLLRVSVTSGRDLDVPASLARVGFPVVHARPDPS